MKTMFTAFNTKSSTRITFILTGAIIIKQQDDQLETSQQCCCPKHASLEFNNALQSYKDHADWFVLVAQLVDNPLTAILAKLQASDSAPVEPVVNPLHSILAELAGLWDKGDEKQAPNEPNTDVQPATDADVDSLRAEFPDLSGENEEFGIEVEGITNLKAFTACSKEYPAGTVFTYEGLSTTGNHYLVNDNEHLILADDLYKEYFVESTTPKVFKQTAKVSVNLNTLKVNHLLSQGFQDVDGRLVINLEDGTKQVILPQDLDTTYAYDAQDTLTHMVNMEWDWS